MRLTGGDSGRCNGGRGNTRVSDTYIVKPVFRALHLLKTLGEADADLTLTEIAARAGVPKTTAFKYLRTLVECGFVAHDDGDRYRIGLVVWQLGQLSGDQRTIREIARPHLTALRERFDETVNLAVLNHHDIVYVEIVQSRRSLRMQAARGEHDPAYATALGKAMLAHLPATQWRSHVPNRLAPRTPGTVTSLVALRAELDQIARRGYALDRGENEEGLSCIAAPVLGVERRLAGAISVSAPTVRLARSTQRNVIDAVRAASDEVSRRLGTVTFGH